ncbi:hypothetical protein CEE69_11210 [Rhodopirellula bahusiensis]|uniref:RES domain-containing protein n=2 Tax=Rhodopirellula bahusiensis TaxID=2014065 RepID=A0A2G1W7J3_9BACT|nr:hypothetical protein CEE69_11210 [Rhodopirellula bahusiensis]
MRRRGGRGGPILLSPSRGRQTVPIQPGLKTFSPTDSAEEPNVQDTDLAPYEKDRMLPNKCVGAGRIKRAGKPVFYGAEDEKTAVMECRPCRGEVLSVATLRTNQDRRILDLSRKSFVGKESTTCFCSKSRSYI